MGTGTQEIAVRVGSVTDAAAVRELVEVAFGPERGRVVNSVVSELDARGLSQSFFVAGVPEGDGQRIVGVVGLSRAWVDARESLVDVLLVGPLAVLPQERGRGVGEQLLLACARYGDEVGAPMLALEGDPGYYRSRGWVEAAEHGVVRPSLRIPSSSCQVRLLKAHQRWMTGQLVYPDTWWRHDLVGLRDPLLAEVERSREPWSRRLSAPG